MHCTASDFKDISHESKLRSVTVKFASANLPVTTPRPQVEFVKKVVVSLNLHRQQGSDIFLLQTK